MLPASLNAGSTTLSSSFSVAVVILSPRPYNPSALSRLPVATQGKTYAKTYVPPREKRRKSIGSAANCTACHRQAEQGNFEEDAIRIPK